MYFAEKMNEYVEWPEPVADKALRNTDMKINDVEIITERDAETTTSIEEPFATTTILSTTTTDSQIKELSTITAKPLETTAYFSTTIYPNDPKLEEYRKHKTSGEQ